MERRQVGFRLKAPLCPERDDDVTVRAFDGDAGVEGQPAVAKGRAFREHDGPPVVGVGVQAPQAAARRGHLGADGDDAAHVVHVRNLRQAKLVRRPVGPGAVLLDGGGISEPAQRRVEARGRALDAVPCDGVKDEARQFRVRPGRFPEVDVQLPREQFQFRRAQGRQPAGRPGHPPDGGEHAGDGTPRGERQPVPQEQVGDAADDAAQERFQGRACRAERGVVREGGREQAPDPRVSEPNHGAARHGSRLPWALRCLPGKKGCA